MRNRTLIILFVALAALVSATVAASRNPIIACFAGKSAVFRASHVLDETDPTDMPDNNMHFRRYIHHTVEVDAYRKESFNFSGGMGTTMDAQTHVNVTGRKICDYTPEELHCPLVLLDVRAKAALNPDYTVSIQDVLDWENDNHKRVPRRAVVAMWSGWDAKYRNETAYRNTDPNFYPYHFPGFGKEVTDFLLNFRNVNGFAVDTLSADNGATTSYYGEHRDAVGAAGKFNLENLQFSEDIPSDGACIVANPLLVCAPESPTNVNIYY